MPPLPSVSCVVKSFTALFWTSTVMIAATPAPAMLMALPAQSGANWILPVVSTRRTRNCCVGTG